MQKSTKKSKSTRKKKDKSKEKNLNTREKRSNEQREGVTGHAQDQLKREPLKEASRWSSELSTSSDVRLLRSLRIHYIKHNGTNFQMSEECFPN